MNVADGVSLQEILQNRNLMQHAPCHTDSDAADLETFLRQHGEVFVLEFRSNGTYVSLKGASLKGFVASHFR